ncbi:MAG: hypothetical protein ACOYMN_08145 [Roseimicrobium sp.]
MKLALVNFIYNVPCIAAIAASLFFADHMKQEESSFGGFMLAVGCLVLALNFHEPPCGKVQDRANEQQPLDPEDYVP